MQQFRAEASRSFRNGFASLPDRGVSHDVDLITASVDNEMLADVIEAAGLGVVLAAEDGWIVYANRIARELLRRGEGLRSTSGWLAAETAGLTAKLRALIKSGATGSNYGPPTDSTLALQRGDDRQPLLAHVIASGLLRCKVPRGPRRAAIVIIDPERYAVLRLEAFSSLYGLTCAESRVLKEIVGGLGVVTAAATLGVSQATARTHMQRIFCKTGTKRQTELLCLFFNAVPLADRPRKLPMAPTAALNSKLKSVCRGC